MRDNLRTRMGWLHSWVGFLGGLILVIVFFGGTLALFDTEITRWMQPEIDVPIGAPINSVVFDQASQQITRLQAQGTISFLNLPSARDPVARVLHYDGHSFVGPILDPRDGHVIPARTTTGGQLFFDLHHSLYKGPFWGNLVVEIAGVGMLVAIGSGIVIQFRNLLPDLLLFRPFANRARAWMDAHILFGILFLPFVAMMAYTGTVIHANRLFPTPAKTAKAPKQPVSFDALPPLAPLFAQAEAKFGTGNVGFILFEPGKISLIRSDAAGLTLTRAHLDFSQRDGTPLALNSNAGTVPTSGGVLRGLHFIRWAPLSLRWIYFISGAVGTLMMASGLVLFLMKYRRQYDGTFFFGLAESLTLAVNLGLPCASLAYLWANRLIPAFAPGRTAMEVEIFFAIWVSCLVYATLRCFGRAAFRGWREILLLLAVLGCGVLPLDLLTRPALRITQEPGVFFGVDFLACVAGIAALFARRRIAVS
ncbi:PepSY-associated TM helix domain-containing protein [Kozakia baliensis]|uniref:Uncharacterized protein n=1 Tax=Kozakia baliensis TaxID=153496 RepID=A0A1D8UUD5_9PROT|nr:PepSY-associated TM helix domain-containing protein [Kozakia baliensis]AOX17249.1 hypothetical protein A0U89_09025 [Kozakia baliensis]GBR29793.1 putative iron-regulated membrane protein [Kozakia baliensis NRIC 0488]GEL63330.1 peptidase [Kozakia baliensis]